MTNEELRTAVQELEAFRLQLMPGDMLVEHQKLMIDKLVALVGELAGQVVYLNQKTHKL